MTIMLAVSLLTMLAQPSGINESANRILLNGDNWSGVIEMVANLSDGAKFNIVHIGDSHVQPGIISDEVRKALQAKYGNGGRGLICPLGLAKTNPPSDFEMKSTSSISLSSKLLSRSKPAGMGMTGVAVKFAGGATTLKLRTKQAGDEFNRITLFHTPGEAFAVSLNGIALQGNEVSPTATEYVLQGLADTASLRLKGNAALFGARLLNDNSGVVVDCIGNNGATYSSYVRIDGFASQLKDLNPQLVIISLGTNEAFGNYSTLESNIDKLVSSIAKECPDAKFLLTTPLETHKKGGKGYVIQTGVADVRDIIMNYGKTHNIPVWDFYTVAGGKGAASRWLSVKYMSSDHLHLLAKGYQFMGDLMSKALLDIFAGEDN